MNLMISFWCISGTEDDANKAVTALSNNAERKNLTLEELLIETPFLGQGGIRSTELVCFSVPFLAQTHNPSADGGSQHHD